MSCYHPLVGFPTGELSENGKKLYKIVPSYTMAKLEVALNNEGAILIPCGKCIGCRLDYSRSWADRMMLELETSKKAVFMTLTYNNESCPWSQFDILGNPICASLDKKHVQGFFKRLRRRFDGKDGHPDRKIRFFVAGEYGDRTLRPHYHAIVFGLGLDDFPDIRSHGTNELGQMYYVSDYLTDIWSFGFTLLSDVSWKTCAYVARYVTKKLNGAYSIDYAIRNCIPEFSLMSRKPGLGKEYLDLHPDCLDFTNINISTSEGGLKIRIPKYYYRQLELTDKDRYDSIMTDRKRFAEDAMILKLQKTGLSYIDYLETQEELKLRKTKVLKRDKVR